MREAIVSGRPYEIEYRIIDASGTERWVSENGQPQRGEAGDALWVDGILSDISERKHNEMRIEGLLAEQSAILDNVMFGVMFVRHRRVVSANRRCEELFGYTNGQLTGGSTALVFPSDDEFAAAGQRPVRDAGRGQVRHRGAPVPAPRRQRVLVPGERLRARPAARPTRAASGCSPTSPSASWPKKSCACRPPCSNTSPTA